MKMSNSDILKEAEELEAMAESDDITEDTPKTVPIYTKAVDNLKQDNLPEGWAKPLPVEPDMSPSNNIATYAKARYAKACQLCTKPFAIYFPDNSMIFCPECIKKLRHFLGIEVHDE